jgi:maltose alpha-D-glucosyltransferase/alpha-amylase
MLMMADLWYKNAIIYSLDVDTFYDSDGDGIGDFRGLTSKLDYLAGLNINCVWLLPFYPSPNRDNGYDVIDYYGVDSRLGTLGDFVEFTHHARERGIRILIDLVLNHTSIDHPWFQAARRDPSSPYRDFYIWSSEKPPDAHEGVVFPPYQESTWSWDDTAQAWYFHRFYDHQPDLNVANPRLREEIERIMGFWLQLGVSGFRLDAAPFMIELKGVDARPGHDPHEYLGQLRQYLSWRRGDAVMLAEANIDPATALDYFGRGDRMQLLFNFLGNQHLFLALARGNAEPIQRSYEMLPRIPPACQWAEFLRNHDELDLGRLSDDERRDVYDRFAPDENMRIYGRGIRRRLAPMFKGDRALLELACSLVLTLPGTPVLRYGDEIGMGEDLSLPERNSVRTPMQWSAERNGGFSSADASALIHPVVTDGEFGYAQVNVEAQQRDPESLLNWTERVLRVRRRCPEFGWGQYNSLETGNPAVLAHTCKWEGRQAIAMHNLSRKHVAVSIRLEGVSVLHDLLANTPHPHTDGRFRVDLPGHGYRWFRAEHQDPA